MLADANANASALAALGHVDVLSDHAAALIVNVSVNATRPSAYALVDGVMENSCYRLQLRSQNALGWGEYSPLGGICCTESFQGPPAGAVDLQKVVFPYIVAGGTVATLLLVFLGVYVFVKYRHLNATLFGGGARKRLRQVEPHKKVEKYMDSHYTPGLDDLDDVVVNPVLVHRIAEVKKAKSKRQANSNGCGTGRSGGLARLNLRIEDKVTTGGGKVKSLLEVENFLAGVEGVNMQEGREVKQREVIQLALSSVLSARCRTSPYPHLSCATCVPSSPVSSFVACPSAAIGSGRLARSKSQSWTLQAPPHVQRTTDDQTRTWPKSVLWRAWRPRRTRRAARHC